jgi:amino acid adenylation domain-containing protein
MEGKRLSYREVADSARSLAAKIQASRSSGPVALLARPSVEAYIGVAGALLSGLPYVPLSLEIPLERNLESLRKSGCSSLLVDAAGRDVIAPALDKLHGLRIVRLDACDTPGGGNWVWPSFEDHSVAYVLFTSGTTGSPKGIRITHANVRAAIRTIQGLVKPRETDRVSQIFEMTFDGSLFGIFLAWTSGACLCPSVPGSVLTFRNHIRSSEITIWGMTPSVARLMRRLTAFKPNSFPSIRYSAVGGEPVPMELLSAWSAAAPNSVVDNLYGPSEATILATGYRWLPQAGASDEIAPIGEFLGETKGKVVNCDFVEVPEGEAGELLLKGPQISPGYLDEERSALSFVAPFEHGETYYRTGDLVTSVKGEMHYLGRLDHQIKVRGNRVELGEIEARMRALAPCDRAVAVPWPKSPGGADGIFGFVEAGDRAVDVRALEKALARVLPRYMQPAAIRTLRSFPVNSHGKIDRAALEELLSPSSAAQRGLIVLGVPRSGTTLLRRLLNGHNSVSCPGETYFLSACARFIQSDAVPKGVSVGVVEGLRHLGMDEDAIFERLRAQFFELHLAHAASQGKSHWAEKTAADVFYIEEIERLIGDRVRFVVLLRHGLDVASSLVELSQRAGGYYRELHRYIAQCPSPFEAFVRMWCDRTNALLDFAGKRPAQVHVIRYEDLVRSPEDVMNAIFRFQGVTEQQNFARVLPQEEVQGIGDWKAYQNSSVRTDRVGQWQGRFVLPPHLADLVNPVLARAGYAHVSATTEDRRLAVKTPVAEAVRLSHLVPRGLSNAT